jgi:hypothetical protein
VSTTDGFVCIGGCVEFPPGVLDCFADFESDFFDCSGRSGLLLIFRFSPVESGVFDCGGCAGVDADGALLLFWFSTLVVLDDVDAGEALLLVLVLLFFFFWFFTLVVLENVESGVFDFCGCAGVDADGALLLFWFSTLVVLDDVDAGEALLLEFPPALLVVETGVFNFCVGTGICVGVFDLCICADVDADEALLLEFPTAGLDVDFGVDFGGCTGAGVIDFGVFEADEALLLEFPTAGLDVDFGVDARLFLVLFAVPPKLLVVDVVDFGSCVETGVFDFGARSGLLLLLIFRFSTLVVLCDVESGVIDFFSCTGVCAGVFDFGARSGLLLLLIFGFSPAGLSGVDFGGCAGVGAGEALLLEFPTAGLGVGAGEADEALFLVLVLFPVFFSLFSFFNASLLKSVAGDTGVEVTPGEEGGVLVFKFLTALGSLKRVAIGTDGVPGEELNCPVLLLFVF